MRILGIIAATSALLAACGETRHDAPAAAPANGSDALANQDDASANLGNSSTNQSAIPVAGTNAAGESPAPAVPAASAAAGPCLSQDGKALSAAAVRAVGTEPFWGARVEGRCVTYSDPEDQKGTRVWTRFTPASGGGTWSGTLDGKRFELRIRPGRGCSDGMSDKSYPLAAELVVGGERRSGCAEPL